MVGFLLSQFDLYIACSYSFLYFGSDLGIEKALNLESNHVSTGVYLLVMY